MKIKITVLVMVLLGIALAGPVSIAGEDDTPTELYLGNDGIYTSKLQIVHSHYAMSYLNYFNQVVVQYYLVNGNWPGSWDDLYEYMPYIPVSIFTAEEMRLESGNELPSRARSDTIFALIEEDGTWLVTVPSMNVKERKFEWLEVERARYIVDGQLEMFAERNTLDLTSPVDRFGWINKLVVENQMRAFYKATGRLASNEEELLLGYKRNDDYKYYWNPVEKVGIFAVEIYPSENAYRYYFRFKMDGKSAGSGFGYQFREDTPFPIMWNPAGGGKVTSTADGQVKEFEMPKRDPDTLESETIFSHTYFTQWKRG